jgi:hypothetical protein
MNTADAAADPVVERWVLSTPAPRPVVWAALSDTDRLNRLAGLAFEFAPPAADDTDSRGTGQQRHLGLTLRWHERPVELVAERSLRIRRDYWNGPVSRVVTTLQLDGQATGTRITFEVSLWPRSALLRPLVAADFRLTVRPGLTRALDALVAALTAGGADPDVSPPPLGPAEERRLALRLRGLRDGELAAALGAHLRTAPLVEQTDLAPRRLALRWGLPVERVLLGLLDAEAAGLLGLQWTLDCPSCGVPAETPRALSLARRGVHCPACRIHFDPAFGEAVALSFRPAPEIRRVLARPRCLSSPARMPHVVAQRGVEARAEVEWALELAPGLYRLRTLPELDVLTLAVDAEAGRDALTVLVGPTTIGPPVARLRSGPVRLVLRSKLDAALTVRLERAPKRADLVTLGDVFAWPEVVARLPGDAIAEGLEVAPYEGWLLAVQVARGGTAGERRVVEALRAAGGTAVQSSTGWVTAALPSAGACTQALAAVTGAPWLGGALGYGAALSFGGPDGALVAGPTVQALVGLAARALPGQILALSPERWPPSATPAPVRLAETPTPAGEWALSETFDGAPLPLPAPVGPPLRPGDTVDARFKLGEQLGLGGFGVVFEALDLRTGDDVVVKVLRQNRTADAEAAQRFFDEGRLAARLSGPHVARVYEWGLTDDGRLFLVMERLTGRELGDILKAQGVVDPVRTLRLLADAARGLATVHAGGLVHRDVKPSNLFVVDEGGPGETVKLIDFGIALDLTGTVPARDRAGMILGTPAYVSPEQVLGEPLDGRSDVYALGLVAHACLAGSVPFEGDTPAELAWARLVVQPEGLAGRSVGPLPPGLAALIDAAVSRERSARPDSAQRFAEALAAVADGLRDPQSWKAAWAPLCVTAESTGELDGRRATRTLPSP